MNANDTIINIAESLNAAVETVAELRAENKSLRDQLNDRIIIENRGLMNYFERGNS